MFRFSGCFIYIFRCPSPKKSLFFFVGFLLGWSFFGFHLGRFREDPRQTGPASPNGATVTFRAAETSGLLFMLLTRYRPQADGPENGVGWRGGGLSCIWLVFLGRDGVWYVSWCFVSKCIWRGFIYIPEKYELWQGRWYFRTYILYRNISHI